MRCAATCPRWLTRPAQWGKIYSTEFVRYWRERWCDPYHKAHRLRDCAAGPYRAGRAVADPECTRTGGGDPCAPADREQAAEGAHAKWSARIAPRRQGRVPVVQAA